MPSITLYIPEELYRRMKKYPEVRWSRIFQTAVRNYLAEREKNKIVGI